MPLQLCLHPRGVIVISSRSRRIDVGPFFSQLLQEPQPFKRVPGGLGAVHNKSTYRCWLTLLPGEVQICLDRHCDRLDCVGIMCCRAVESPFDMRSECGSLLPVANMMFDRHGTCRASSWSRPCQIHHVVLMYANACGLVPGSLGHLWLDPAFCMPNLRIHAVHGGRWNSLGDHWILTAYLYSSRTYEESNCYLPHYSLSSWRLLRVHADLYLPTGLPR